MIKRNRRVKVRVSRPSPTSAWRLEVDGKYHSHHYGLHDESFHEVLISMAPYKLTIEHQIPAFGK
jgi:hypothetical protein